MIFCAVILFSSVAGLLLLWFDADREAQELNEPINRHLEKTRGKS